MAANHATTRRAMFAGAAVAATAIALPAVAAIAPTVALSALIARYDAHEANSIAEEERADEESRVRADDPALSAAYAKWDEATERLFAYQPTSVAELALMVDFFAAKTEGGDHFFHFGGEWPIAHLQRMTRGFLQRGGS